MGEGGGLAFDRGHGRWVLGGEALHCGDGLEIRVAGRWLAARVEFEDRHGCVLHLADGVRVLPSGSLPARRARWDRR